MPQLIYIAIGVLALTTPSNNVTPARSSEWSLSIFPRVGLQTNSSPLVANVEVVMLETLGITPLLVAHVRYSRRFHQFGSPSSWSATKRVLVLMTKILSFLVSILAKTLTTSMLEGS